jgi:hypothetical protein
MRFLILLSLISFNVFSSDLKSFEEYRNNFQLFSSDITKVAAIAERSESPIYKDMLQDMNKFKDQYDHLATPLKLADFHQDAVDNGWVNLQKMSKELIPLCETSGSQSSSFCKNGLERMRMFALNSKLADSIKESLSAFIDDYLLQITAFEMINKDFITKFNNNVKAINLSLQTPIQKHLEVQITPTTVSGTSAIAKDIFASKNLYLGLISLIIIAMVGAELYKKSKKKKRITIFYGKLFKLAKKNQIQLKVFGSISPSEAGLVNNIEMPFLNSVYLSRAVSSKAQVKFKNKKNDLSIEIIYTTSRSIQSVMSMPKEKAFRDSLESLQKKVEAEGGEFSFSNSFNSIGDLVQSSLLLQLPKGEILGESRY